MSILPRRAQHRENHAWIYVVIVGAVFSIGLFFIGRYTARTLRRRLADEAATVSSIPQKSIAVLPFENLSDDKGAAYFADGIQDEILTKLASIADLKVISRTSTAKYKSKPEDLKTVSQQLGVANCSGRQCAEGGRQSARQRAAHRCPRRFTSLGQNLRPRHAGCLCGRERSGAGNRRFAKGQTFTGRSQHSRERANERHAAYDLFLKGEFEQRVANSNFRPESFDQAARWYKEAIARDPNFALAIAQLAICQLRRHWLTDPLSEAELMEAGRLAKQALTLAPDLAEAHVARWSVSLLWLSRVRAGLN